MKKKVFFTSLVLASLMSIGVSYGAEDGIVYYDDTILDIVLNQYEDFEKSLENPKEESQKEEPTYHYKEDGSLAKGLTDLDDVRRYFDKKTGQIVKNKTIASENIHVDEDGIARHIGWDYYKGKLGYYDPKTGYAKGLKQIGNITYGFDQDGLIFRKQNRIFNGKNYYFNNYGEAIVINGSYAKGWVGDRYYYQDGKPAEGLATINGKKYAFHERSLRLLRNTNKVFGHKMYAINGKGEAIFKYNVAHSQLRRGTEGRFRPGFSQNLMRKTPYFSQNDPRWKNTAYSSSTIGKLGCGPTAMAMVLNRKLSTKIFIRQTPWQLLVTMRLGTVQTGNTL